MPQNNHRFDRSIKLIAIFFPPISFKFACENGLKQGAGSQNNSRFSIHKINIHFRKKWILIFGTDEPTPLDLKSPKESGYFFSVQKINGRFFVPEKKYPFFILWSFRRSIKK